MQVTTTNQETAEVGKEPLMAMGKFRSISVLHAAFVTLLVDRGRNLCYMARFGLNQKTFAALSRPCSRHLLT